MYDSEKLSEKIRPLIADGLTAASIHGFPVVDSIEKTGAARYVVFSTEDLPSMDNRNQLELEINVIGPMSEAVSVRAATDAIIGALDRAVVMDETVGFYLYKSTRNRVDGSDPHVCRYRCTFDLYLYERADF